MKTENSNKEEQAMAFKPLLADVKITAAYTDVSTNPEKSGEYEILNNSPECNGGQGLCYYDVENGWDIPDAIKSFFKIRKWRHKQ